MFFIMFPDISRLLSGSCFSVFIRAFELDVFSRNAALTTFNYGVYDNANTEKSKPAGTPLY